MRQAAIFLLIPLDHLCCIILSNPHTRWNRYRWVLVVSLYTPPAGAPPVLFVATFPAVGSDLLLLRVPHSPPRSPIHCTPASPPPPATSLEARADSCPWLHLQRSLTVCHQSSVMCAVVFFPDFFPKLYCTFAFIFFGWIILFRFPSYIAPFFYFCLADTPQPPRRILVCFICEQLSER